MISIIIVNHNGYDFLRLLIESIDQFTTSDWDAIIVDNNTQPETIGHSHVYQFIMRNNIGHGEGLNLAAQKANELFPSNSFALFLDCDTHFLKLGWNELFTNIGEFDVIAAKGVEAKPIRPACMFMKQKILNQYDWRASPNYQGHRITPQGTDVAIAAYHQMIRDGIKIKFLESFPNRYDTFTGEEWGLEGIPLVYHHWHGSHLTQRQVDFPVVDLKHEKNKLFAKIPWRQI